MNSTENTECGLTGNTLLENDVKQGNDTGRISGIYKIVNKANGKYYVGSSKNMSHRFHEHKTYLRHNYHFNDHLQHAWNKYGELNFEFIIFEQYPNIDRKTLLDIEQKYLDMIKQTPSIAYNLRYEAKGGEMSEYSKKKIGDKNRGRIPSSEARLKMSLAHKNRPPMSNITKQKISLSHKGNKNPNYHKTPSDETLLKLSAAMRGRSNPRFINTIYTFQNKYTNDTFTGVCYDFRNLYRISSGRMAKLIREELKHVKGWVLQSAD